MPTTMYIYVHTRQVIIIIIFCQMPYVNMKISYVNICRYNFDPVKGLPLVGRYEWVKVNP